MASDRERALPTANEIRASLRRWIATCQEGAVEIHRLNLEPWEAEALDWPTELYGLPVNVVGRVASDE